MASLRIKLGDEHQETPSCPGTAGAAELCEENETPPTPKKKDVYGLYLI
jgi:hypothetical protein